MPAKIHVVNHTDLLNCLATYFGCPINDLYNMPFHWSDDAGNHVWGMRRYIRCIKQRGTWGFAENKKRIHIWFKKGTSEANLLKLLAHEIGHLQRPWKRNRILEETKAINYAYVALSAYEIMLNLKEIDNE